MAYKSDALKSLHSTVEDLEAVGAVDKVTKRRFDQACLRLAPLGPADIKAIRDGANVSQSVFALALNVTTHVVSKWERGEKRPSGPSLKLLTLVQQKGFDVLL